MKFCWATLHVKNLEESLEFYIGAMGLDLNRRFEAGDDMEIAFLGDGETKLELIWDKTRSNVNTGQDISIGFEVESVDKMMKHLKEKGIKIESGIFMPNPHIKFFYVKDPNGLKVQLVENIL